MAEIRAHLVISGEVQGVCYRASAQEQAESLGLGGWVKNLYDGNVEAEVEGPEVTVDRFIEWCKVGPRSAQVDGVEVRKSPSRGEYTTFSIRR